MSTEIYHGPPGSYKSSTVLWFRLLDALRQGRVVITNLQGLKTIDEIQFELGEIFPATAKIFRISIGHDRGLNLMRNFYQWMPIGAFIFIDEVQDVYPNDKTFKAHDYDNKGEGYFDSQLPVELVELYHKEQREIKDNVDLNEYLDDVGESLFDERGYLRYPRTMRECFMRHRHYNWDIIFATPDIKEVIGFVRSATEKGYAHVSKDAIPIKYFKRRPRVLEHPPKENGMSVKKGDITTHRKIPLDVFKLYKSTATGKNTKSGAGGSPFDWRHKIGLAFVVGYIVFLINFFTDGDDTKEVLSGDKIPNIQKVDNQKTLPKNKVNNKENSPLPIKDNGENTSFVARHGSVSELFANDNNVNLPYNAQSMYLTGLVTESLSKNNIKRHYIFNLLVDGYRHSITSDDLYSLGYKVFYKSDCLVELRAEHSSNFVYCELKKRDETPVQNDELNSAVRDSSLVASLG